MEMQIWLCFPLSSTALISSSSPCINADTAHTTRSTKHSPGIHTESRPLHASPPQRATHLQNFPGGESCRVHVGIAHFPGKRFPSVRPRPLSPTPATVAPGSPFRARIGAQFSCRDIIGYRMAEVCVSLDLVAATLLLCELVLRCWWKCVSRNLWRDRRRTIPGMYMHFDQPCGSYRGRSRGGERGKVGCWLCMQYISL